MHIGRIGWRALQLFAALSLAIAQFAPAGAQARRLDTLVSLSQVYTQNFDGLPYLGTTIYTWNDDQELPGWYSSRTVSISSPSLIATSGRSNAASLFSFGANASSPNDRALGSAAGDATGDIYYGVKLTNDTSQPVKELTITYTGEQWRDGGVTLGGTAGPQTLAFDYSLDALVLLNSGAWNSVRVLDFVTPKFGASGAVSYDGNSEGNHAHLSASIPVAIPPNGFIWLRWKDTNDINNDHGIGIDDLRVEATFEPVTDLPPSVISSSPVSGASGVAVNTTIQVAFSEPVTVSSGYSLVCDGQPAALNAIKMDAAYTFTPLVGLSPSATCLFTIPSGSVKDSWNQGLAADFSIHFTITDCGASFTHLYEIQGEGSSSPLAGSTVTVEGIVTADFQTESDLSGFFLQSTQGEEDAEPATSEGVFVSLLNTANELNTGDRVRLTGTVMEATSAFPDYGQFAAMTEIASVSTVEKCASNQPLPEPVHLILPADVDPQMGLEPFEGMLVSIAGPDSGPLTVQENAFQGALGQLLLATGGRVFQRNNGSGASADDLQRMVALDDHSTLQNPSLIPYYASDGAVRSGDTVTNLVGVLDQGRINLNVSTSPTDLVFPNVYYRLQHTSDPVFTQASPRPNTPPEVGGSIRIAGFNVQNYFLTLDSNRDLNAGANTEAELQRQKGKLVTAFSAIRADVFGLVAVEADDSKNAPDDLSAALNARISQPGAFDYRYIPDPAQGTGSDRLQAVLLYNAITVSPAGDPISDPARVFDRAPLAQTFTVNATGEQFTVVVNHFTSRDACPAPGSAEYEGNADQGDGQGCWATKRTAQAAALLNFVETLKQTDPDVVVIGDLNAYAAEDPIAILTNGGLVNQVAAKIPQAQRYSYVSNGAAGYPDHALTTRSVSRQLTGAAFWHINADEPRVIDYNMENKAIPPETAGSPDWFNDALPFRSSDHDPLLIGLNLTANHAPVLASAIEDQEAWQGKLFTFAIPAGVFSDPDSGDALTYSAAQTDGSPLPTWLSFDGAVFRGTPDAQDVMPLAITVTATDTSGAAVRADFNLAVLQNQAPVFDLVAPQTVKELETLTFTVSATDDGMPDASLTYTAENIPPNAVFDPGTREFRWTPGKDQGEYPYKTYTVTFKVSDGGQVASMPVDIQVMEANTAPFFTDPGLLNTNELELFTLELSAHDENVPPPSLTFQYLSLPDGAVFDAVNHTVTWKPTEAQGPGDYQAEFWVSDGELSDTLTVNIHVNEKNAGPVLSAIEDQTASEHGDWFLQAIYSDPDLPANHFTFRLEDAPDRMTVDASGLLTWNPDETQGGSRYLVTLYLSDGQVEVSQSFWITVEETNSAPYFTNLKNQTVGPFYTLTFSVTAVDDDLPEPLLSIAVDQATLPAGASFIFDPASGKGTFTWQPGPHAAGTYHVVFVLTDGETPVRKEITITVTEPDKVFLPAMYRTP